MFNGDYVLQQLISSVYPFAHKIIFVDGVVDFWAKKGFTGSTDKTIDIIEKFYDPQKKIIYHQNVVAVEKTELCRTFMRDVPEDTDYLWCIDSDEIFKFEHIKKIIYVLETLSPVSVGFQSTTFFGGFDYILGGFEREHTFKRILKYKPGAVYIDHRPPTLSSENGGSPAIGGAEMFNKFGVEMYHYSYVFANQVRSKIQYYKKEIAKHNCIDDYFEKVWLPWVKGNDLERQSIQSQYIGVHEFKPSYRGPCYPELFTGEHPLRIAFTMDQLKKRFDDELSAY